MNVVGVVMPGHDGVKIPMFIQRASLAQLAEAIRYHDAEVNRLTALATEAMTDDDMQAFADTMVAASQAQYQLVVLRRWFDSMN